MFSRAEEVMYKIQNNTQKATKVENPNYKTDFMVIMFIFLSFNCQVIGIIINIDTFLTYFNIY
jgi:hypothetical protein